MLLRILLFLGVALLVLGGACTYMARRSMALCPGLARHPFWIWGFFAAFLVLLFGVPLLNRLSGNHLDGIHWIGYFQFSFVSTFFVYLMLADLAQFLLRRLAHVPASAGLWAFLGAAFLALLSVGLGAITALRPAPLRTVDVPIEGLPSGLDGFRIVQISDLHLGPLVSGARVQSLVDRVNALQPDLIAVTGDLVDGQADGVRSKVERMKGLQATHGVCFVTGNHEYYAGAARWLDVIRRQGWKVLLNTHETLEHRGAPLAVAGLPDPASRGRRGYGQGPNLAEAMEGIPSGTTKLLLFHQPLGYREAAAAGVALQLSGHTHGGQYFPWSLVVDAIYAFPTGLHRHDGMWIYTSAGTGFWGPPNRLLVPPELTLLVLKRPA